MSIYKCTRCGYETPFSSHIKRHINRKKLCTPMIHANKPNYTTTTLDINTSGSSGGGSAAAAGGGSNGRRIPLLIGASSSPNMLQLTSKLNQNDTTTITPAASGGGSKVTLTKTEIAANSSLDHARGIIRTAVAVLVKEITASRRLYEAILQPGKCVCM